RITADKKSAGPLLDKRRKGGVDLVRSASIQHAELPSQDPRRCLYVRRFCIDIGTRGIDEHCDRRARGNQLVQQFQSLRSQSDRDHAYARDVAARPVETCYETKGDRVSGADENDWNGRCRRLRREPRVNPPHSSDYGYLSANQVGRKLRQSIVLKVRPTKFDRQISTFDIAIFLQALRERIGHIFRFARRPGAEIADRRRRPLLPTRRDRPRGRAAEQRDELAPPHSITSSARASKLSGTVRPSAFAVLRLITSSNLVGCSI